MWGNTVRSTRAMYVVRTERAGQGRGGAGGGRGRVGGIGRIKARVG
jgi:hypothetical protein